MRVYNNIHENKITKANLKHIKVKGQLKLIIQRPHNYATNLTLTAILSSIK